MPFHLPFLNAELERLDLPGLPEDRFVEFNDIVRNRLQTNRIRLQDVTSRLGIKGIYPVLRCPEYDVKIMAEAMRRMEIPDCQPQKLVPPERQNIHGLKTRYKFDFVMNAWGAPFTIEELLLRSALRKAKNDADDFPQLLANIHEAGIRLLPRINREGGIAGLRFERGETSISTSETGMTLQDLIGGRRLYGPEQHLQLLQDFVARQDAAPDVEEEPGLA